MPLDELGVISFPQFVKLMEAKVEYEDDVRMAFMEFDSDGNGLISCEEVLLVADRVGVKLTREMAEEMIEVADKDRDGQVNFTEFLSMMTSK